ncbi:hypothetical protein HHI36_001741, partial [Cryptolaemus montrouzieri]
SDRDLLSPIFSLCDLNPELRGLPIPCVQSFISAYEIEKRLTLCATRSKLNSYSSSSATVDKEPIQSEDQPIPLKHFNELSNKISELSVGLVSLNESVKTVSPDVSVIKTPNLVWHPRCLLVVPYQISTNHL